MFLNSFDSSSNLVAFPKPSFMQLQEVVQAQEVKFSNPFRDGADKKESILEHHVSMTEKQATCRTISEKYRKGRCRHGYRYSFTHNSDMSKFAVV